MNEDPKFIHLTGRENSDVTGEPHRISINIADIVSVEQINYQYVINEDEIGWREGVGVTIRDCCPLEARETIDVVLASISLAAAGSDWSKVPKAHQDILQNYWASLGMATL